VAWGKVVGRATGGVVLVAAASLAAWALTRRTPPPDSVMIGDCWPPVPLNEARRTADGHPHG
jgi:hypothetical protein